MTEKKIYQIAKNAYNVCRAFEISNEGEKTPLWSKLREEDRELVIKSVELLLENNRTYASSVHDAWIDNMIEKGWTYGKEYDEKLQTNPHMIDYRSLPHLQRAKDRLFHQVVKIGYIEPSK